MNHNVREAKLPEGALLGAGAVPAKEPQVQAGLKNLDAVISHSETLIKTLYDKLTPVLRNLPGGDAMDKTAEDKSVLVPLAHTIDTLRSRQIANNRAMEELLQLIEL